MFSAAPAAVTLAQSPPTTVVTESSSVEVRTQQPVTTTETLETEEIDDDDDSDKTGLWGLLGLLGLGGLLGLKRKRDDTSYGSSRPVGADTTPRGSTTH
jgi:LPXTG-motif cell wall-anchored protein